MPSRRDMLAIAALLAATRAGAQPVPILAFLTAGPDSDFLSYGERIANVVNASGVLRLDVIQTGGSIENLSAVEADPGKIATVFIGAAYEAIGGVGPFAGRSHAGIRAIAPMYETVFLAAAKAGKGIGAIADLAGKRVGVGPAGGPAEAFFKGLAEAVGFEAVLVAGAPAELEAAYLADGIDAFWQGASVPIPALTRVAQAAPSIVFGLSEAELAAMLRRFPYLAAADVPAGSYPGQTQPLRSVAASNVIVAHAALPDDIAYELALTILGEDTAPPSEDPTTMLAQSVRNRVVPWHPGAASFLRDKGVAL